MNSEAPTAAWIEKASSEDYSATMTGNPFLFRETKLLAELLVGGIPLEEARANIEERNLFQYRSTKSIPKRVNAVGRRLHGVPQEVLRALCAATVDQARLINLLLLAVKDRLFRELLLEVVVPAYATDTTFSPLAVERFLDAKAVVSPKVASWKPEARTKLRTVWIAGLSECGILDRDMLIQRPVPSPEMANLIEACFTKPFRVIAGVGR